MFGFLAHFFQTNIGKKSLKLVSAFWKTGNVQKWHFKSTLKCVRTNENDEF
jgi:hypothetical protein